MSCQQVRLGRGWPHETSEQPPDAPAATSRVRRTTFGTPLVKDKYTPAASGDRERLLQNARKVLEATRRLEGKIADAKAWTAIHERADKLELRL
jgi:hypothetical protein